MSGFHLPLYLFFPFGIYPDGNFHHARQRRLLDFSGKNPSVIACCTPRHGVRKAAPPRVLRNFLIFRFPKIAACLFKRVSGSSAGCIQFVFEVGFLKKQFYLRTDDNAKDVVAVSQSQITLQPSTSSYKISLSRPFVEGSTADTVIQVAERRLWRGIIPN